MARNGGSKRFEPLGAAIASPAIPFTTQLSESSNSAAEGLRSRVDTSGRRKRSRAMIWSDSSSRAAFTHVKAPRSLYSQQAVTITEESKLTPCNRSTVNERVDKVHTRERNV